MIYALAVLLTILDASPSFSALENAVRFDGSIISPSELLTPEQSPAIPSALAFTSANDGDDDEPRTVYLDDLKETGYTLAPGTKLKKHGWINGPEDNKRLVRMRGRKQTHSLYTHAIEQGTAWVEYRIDKRYYSFQGHVGIAKSEFKQAASPVVFAIVGDGRELWRSRPVQRNDVWEEFRVDISKVAKLRLEVRCNGPVNAAWSMWIAPLLVGNKGKVAAAKPGAPTPPPRPASPSTPVDETIATNGEVAADIKLNEPLTRICWGGSGRFLIGHLPKAGKLAIVDAVVGKLVKHIETGGKDVRFAANRTDLIVAFGGERLVRYSLSTLEEELERPIRVPVEIARMGCAGNGPLLLWWNKDVRIFDPQTLLPIFAAGSRFTGDPKYKFEVRTSASGRSFTGWHGATAPARFGMMKLANNRLSTISSPGGYSQNEWWASPSADGKQGILFAGRLLDESLKESPSTLPKDTIWVPTADARFMLSVTRAGNKETSRITAHQGTAAKEFFVFEKTAPVTMSSMPTRWGYMTGEPRVMLAADLKRLTIVAEPNDRVVVRKFDAFEALGRPLRNANAKQVALLDRRGVFVPPAAPMKADDMVAFEEGHSPAVLNYSGTGHWRVFNDQLILLGPDGVKVTKQAKLPKAYTHIRERREYLVAMNTKTKDFDIIDKRTFRIQAGGKLPGLEAIDIVLHPTLPVSYVSYKADIEIPRFQFLVVDERTGKSKSNPEFLGEYMKVSPDGRYLLVGYHDIYRRGSRLILNPQRWHITPTYGSLDWLLCYDLTRTGEPIIREVKLNAGGNCQGLRLTPDGGRVVFLSFAGSPSQSKQLQALQVDKLDAEPLVFQMKEIATPTTIAFHPKRNIAASPGSGSAAFFDTKMGAEIPSLCRAIPAIVAQGEVADVWFSANGENLVFDLRIADQQHFVKAALDLSRASVRTSRSTRPRPSPRPPKSVKKADPAPLKDLTALAGDVGGDPMSPKEISREFATSVVIVANEEGSGTGFAVGENGYVLTCAHCVSHTSQNWVYFQSTPNSKPHKRTAEVVRVDVAKDMALLKIVSKLKPTRLLISGAVESGERVVVIGNPGLGELVLDQTLTEGIVSNAKRRFEGVDYMQTSAAVNPGSSGGPVFNEQGTVIGMVALKGRIEGVGFAITAEELAKFLIAGATRAGDKGKLTRLWVDSTGQFKIRASLERVLGNRVQLINDDGARSVEIDKLSERDRQFLRLLGHGK